MHFDVQYSVEDSDDEKLDEDFDLLSNLSETPRGATLEKYEPHSVRSRGEDLVIYRLADLPVGVKYVTGRGFIVER